jgi:alpha-tubulin suppressor-like RCC1 family protein
MAARWVGRVLLAGVMIPVHAAAAMTLGVVTASPVSASPTVLHSRISAGENFTCAITSEGAAQCWGRNNLRQLGDGTTTDAKFPVQVLGLTSGVTDISAGLTSTCAVVNGAVVCWGQNVTPATIAGLSSGVTSVSTNTSHRLCDSERRSGVLGCKRVRASGERHHG